MWYKSGFILKVSVAPYLHRIKSGFDNISESWSFSYPLNIAIHTSLFAGFVCRILSPLLFKPTLPLISGLIYTTSLKLPVTSGLQT